VVPSLKGRGRVLYARLSGNEEKSNPQSRQTDQTPLRQAVTNERLFHREQGRSQKRLLFDRDRKGRSEIERDPQKKREEENKDRRKRRHL